MDRHYAISSGGDWWKSENQPRLLCEGMDIAHFFFLQRPMKLISSSFPLSFSLLDFRTGGQVKLLAGIIANYTPYLA